MIGRIGARVAGSTSFAEVYNTHHRSAVRLAWLLTGDPHQAEDAVAEAFAKVWVKWDQGRVHDLGPYLRRTVVNEVRSRGRRTVLERREAERRTGDDRGVRTHDDAAAEQDLVWRSLGQLPDRQRQAVVLRYYEDLPEAEVAEILGVSVGTVKSQVSRGLEKLREIVATAGESATGGGS